MPLLLTKLMFVQSILLKVKIPRVGPLKFSSSIICIGMMGSNVKPYIFRVFIKAASSEDKANLCNFQLSPRQMGVSAKVLLLNDQKLPENYLNHIKLLDMDTS